MVTAWRELTCSADGNIVTKKTPSTDPITDPFVHMADWLKVDWGFVYRNVRKKMLLIQKL